jgi:hypothetical protein
MKKFYTTALMIGLCAATASCTTAQAESYKIVQRGEHQLPGHPYKTANDCERRAPIGKFDAKCDIPVVGFRNFSDPTIGVGAGSVGGFGLGGM